MVYTVRLMLRSPTAGGVAWPDRVLNQLMEGLVGREDVVDPDVSGSLRDGVLVATMGLNEETRAIAVVRACRVVREILNHPNSPVRGVVIGSAWARHTPRGKHVEQPEISHPSVLNVLGGCRV